MYWPWHGNQLKDQDVAHVAHALAALDADVVLLQELLHAGQVERLAGHRYAGAMSARCGYDRHVGVLVRRDLGPVFEDGRLEPTARGVLSAKFKLGGHEVFVAALHFDVFRPPRRLAQARAAAALLEAQTADLLVAGGDFNYDPGISARLGRAVDAETEATLTSRLRDVASCAGPTLVGFLRVDRLLAGGRALGQDPRFTDARVCPQRTPLGDHAPLLCDFDLSNG